MIINCTKNYGYKWCENQNVCFKGYFFIDTEHEKIYSGYEAIRRLNTIATFSDFISFLSRIDGIYSIIIKNDNSIWAAVDISRSMPLYFDVKGKIISDSSEYIRKELKIDKEQTDKLRLLEMYESTFVAYNNTVYENIKQLDAGQAVNITNGNIEIKLYFLHIADTEKFNHETASAKLERISDDMIKGILRIVGDRPIVLSLSGGYDSRYIACLLKKHGVDNVSCYSYGNDNSFEVAQSKIIADRLGYRWKSVYYSNKMIRNILSEENSGYFEMCNEHDYITYIQNYMAVKYLHDMGWFYKNSVFLTGLCHDMPTGMYVKAPKDRQHYEISAKGVAEYIVDERFIRYPLMPHIRDILVYETLEKIKDIQLTVSSDQDFIRVVDCITTSYDHSRRFLNMNRVHEYFGYQWLLPCWNKQLLRMWYSLPYGMRIKQNFYENWLMESLFSQFHLATKKQNITFSPNPKILSIQRFVGGIITRILYPLNIPLKRRIDHNNFSSLEVMFYKNIIQKKAINYQRAAITILSAIYIMEQRYGKNFYMEIKKMIK